MSARPRESIVLHGRRLAYVRTGKGPTVLLVHGILSSADTWGPLIDSLADEGLSVLAPDLPGHGESQRLRGDHSLGALACVLRDLCDALEIGPVSVVGHSLGGGIAMQFSYQFPERVERLALLGSGGLGREVSVIIRVAALFGAEPVIAAVSATPPLRLALRMAGAVGRRVGLLDSVEAQEILVGLESLGTQETRAGFVRTVRAVVTPWGQRVSATDKLYLTGELPILIAHGENDRIIPADHARAGAAAAGNATLVIVPDAGHFLHLDAPDVLAAAIGSFVRDTPPFSYDLSRSRALLLAGALKEEQAG